MRIAHVIIGLNVGGAELMLKRLVESYPAASGYSHSVISLTQIGVVGEQMKAAGIPVAVIGMRSALDVPRVLVALVRILRKTRPDVVQTWMYHADLLGGLAARVSGNSNIIWGVRTTDVNAGGVRATTFVMYLCALLSRVIPRKIVCAANASRRVHARAGYDDKRMVVIPNGFNIDHLKVLPGERTAFREQYGFSTKNLVIGTLGRFNLAKDHKNFVQAAGLLCEKFPDLRFLLVGRGLDSSNIELNQWILDTGFPDRFVLLGERSDVPKCLSAMDIFCLSSRTEGFPNVVGEAMAMGVPCVVTNVGDAAFLVGETGIVVPRENSAALATGIERLLTMPADEREALGKKARERIHAEFTMERVRERFDSVYHALSERDI
nr:glycosyltransferase [Massilia sp. PDC64]